MVNPFVVGYHTDIDSSTGEIRKQDGCIAAIQTFMFMVSLGLATIIAHWVTLKTQSVYVSRIVVEIIMCTYMLLGIVIITCMWRAKCASNLHINPEPEVPRDLLANGASNASMTRAVLSWFRCKIRRVLPIIGVVLFYCIGVFTDLLRGIAHLSCMYEFYTCGLHVFSRYVFSVTFHAIRILFMGLSMVFCCYFYNRVFIRSIAVRYGLLVILAASITVWFDCTLYDSNGILQEEDETYRNTCNNNNSMTNTSACVTETTELYRLLSTVSPYIFPFNIEFLLLVMEMIIQLFVSCAPKEFIEEHMEQIVVDVDERDFPDASRTQEETTTRRRRLHKNNTDTAPGCSTDASLSDSSMTTGAFNVNNENKDPVLVDLQASLTAAIDKLRDISTVRPDTHTSHNTQEQHNQLGSLHGYGTTPIQNEPLLPASRHVKVIHQSHSADDISSNSLLCFFLSLLFNFILITMGLLTFLTDDRQDWLVYYQGTKIVYWCVTLAVCIVGFNVTNTWSSKFHNFHGLEMAVMLSVFGFTIYSFLTISSTIAFIAGTHKEKLQSTDAKHLPLISPSLPWLLTLDNILNIAQLFVQTTFMSHASRVKVEIVDDARYDGANTAAPGAITDNQDDASSHQDNRGVTTSVEPVGNAIDTDVQTGTLRNPVANTSDASRNQSIEAMTSHDFPEIQFVTHSPSTLTTTCSSDDRLQTRAASHSKTKRQRRIFLNVLLFMSLVNLTAWLSDSFIELKNPNLGPIQSSYYGHLSWELISHITMPLCLFYRFNSFIIFTEIFLDN